MNQQHYLSIEEVAERFGLSRTTIYRLASKGKIPAFKVGGCWRFSSDILEAWVADKVVVERFKREEEGE